MLVGWGNSAWASTVLGTGAASLLGSDLTDPDNNGIDGTDGLSGNWNWTSINASGENYWTSEGAYNVFDNKVSSGEAKWCCDNPTQWISVGFAKAYVLTHFTITSGNDSVGRDPDQWKIQGSNDGSSWSDVYTYSNDGTSPFSARNQVVKYSSAGSDFSTPSAYSYFRYYVTSTVSSGHQINELEFFGDEAIPAVSSVSSNTDAGGYKVGDVIDIDVVFSVAVTVTGTPQLTLETGDTDRVINYSSGSGTSTLTFNYTVQAGDTASDLDYTSTTALVLNSGTIKDATNNTVPLTLPTVGGSDSLAGNEALVIDTTTPTNQNTVFASVVTKAGGATVTITSSGDSTNDVWFAPAGTTSFSAGATMTIAASGTATSIAAPADTGTYYLYVLDAAGNISSASSAALTVDAGAPIITFSPVDGATGVALASNITITFDEAIRNTDDTVLTDSNIDSLITLKTTNSSGANIAFDATINTAKTIITINPTSNFSIAQVVYVGIGVSVEDSYNNAISAANATFAVLSDSTSPTIAITATGVTDGSTSDASTLALTFTASEATSNFVVEDITVSNATLSSLTAVSSTVYTAILTPTTQGAVTIDVAAGSFTDAASNNNTASTQFNWTYLSSPINKTDVTDSIKAMSGVAIDAVGMNFSAVESRVGWLQANTNSNKLSHQGVRLSFANPTIDKLMNTAYVEPGKLSPTNKLLELLRNNLADGTPDTMAMTEDTKAQLNSAAFNEVAKLREETIGKVLNATGGSVMGDWNVWTEGRITVGKTYSTGTTSEQDSQTQNISLGFDRIIKDDNQSSESAGHIVGVVLGIGKSDADTTNNSTVDADSYSISTYGVIRQDDKELVQAQIGYGHIKVDKTRIDGSDTLTGSHNANQFFTTLMVKRETMSVGSFSLSPYGKIHASRTWYDGYSEKGGATALTYGEQTIDSTVLSAGVDVDYMIPIHKGNIRPFAKFEYGADVSGSSTVNMHYNNEATNYQLQLDNKADSNWKFVLGADMYTKEEWDSSISYERTEAVDAGYSDSLAVKVGLKF
ncbi:autotransporter domain-containing protein [Candidatus Thioglobus sp.]|nr:autotransporter domain-containing protein [Candidatus Thioglobus sp.]